jgi:VWFA-related protein
MAARRYMWILTVVFLLSAYGQAPEKQDFSIKVGVEEVRLDAIVLDQKGKQISDLTADEFEIYQDGGLQKITSSTYINEYQPQPEIKTDSLSKSQAMLSISAPMLKRENVRRTMVFIVDNYLMGLDQIYYARMALRKFVETQYQPGDLLAIVPTAGGNGAVQMFSSDKQHLLSIIRNIRWHFPLRTTQTTPQFMLLMYYIRALQEMPGRKSLILISRQVRGDADMEEAFNPLADAALRAGVVVHTMDIAGLAGLGMYGQFGAEHGLNCSPESVASGSCFQNRINDISMKAYERNTKKPIPLSKKTGGLFIEDSNYFVTKSGIGRASEALKGYYLLTYIPPADTFSKGLKSFYHRIALTVKRPKSVVHTRDRFFGISPANVTPGDPDTLQTAIFSPFRYNNLDINLASGYIHDSRKGYLVKSWLHLDGKDLSIVEDGSGMQSIMLDAACVALDAENVIQDSGSRRYEYILKNEEVSWVKKHGLKFSLTLPIRNPGSYYVRAAIKDQRSGKIGSAYQFIEIPDLKKGQLSLSNIFIMNRDEDAPWVQSQASEESRRVPYPDMKRDPRKSPALRSYLPGESINCAAVLYNANKIDKLESQLVLYENGKEYFKGELKPVDLSGANDINGIRIWENLQLENSTKPGDYVLLMLIQEEKKDKKVIVAAQALDFKVLSE